MKLAALEAFVKVVQAGSFTRAADLLGTQKARLSRVVSQLERELGARLLERTTRSLHLTDIGRAVFERAQGLLAASDELAQFTRALQVAPSGTLKLTCGTDFGLVAANDWIATYQQRFPAVAIDVDFTSRVVDLVHEGFDLALRVGPLEPSRLAARKLGEQRYGLYASPTHLRRNGRPATPAALADAAWLVLARSRATLRLLRDGAEQRVAPTRAPALVANSTYMLLAACEAGLGVAQLPWAVADSAVHAGHLLPLLTAWEPAPVPVHAVFPSNRYLAPKVRAFIDHAVDRFSASMPRAAPVRRASRPGPTRR